MIERRHLIVSSLIAGVIVAVGVAGFLRPAEPRYEGHALCYWLERLNSDDNDLSARAYAAVERIAPDSLSQVRRLLALRDDQFTSWIRTIAARLPWTPEVRGPEYWRFRARLALGIMGAEHARQVLPDCQSMLRDSDPRVREDAVEVLGGMLGYAAPALSDLELALKDRDSGVRRSAEVAIRNVRGNMNLPEFRQTELDAPYGAHGYKHGAPNGAFRGPAAPPWIGKRSV